MLGEFLDMLHLAFAGETFTYDGQHYRMPSTHISARPVAGLPEIWIAGDHEFGHRLCARRGYVPLFTGRWGGADYQREMRNRIAAAYVAEGRDPDTHAARRPALHVRHGKPRRDARLCRQRAPPDAPGVGAATPCRGHRRRDDARDPDSQ